MTVLSFIMGIPILEDCIFILEMYPGGQHKKKTIHVFTRGQFWPSGIVVACVCLCVRLCVR